jgi:hypothetical protein
MSTPATAPDLDTEVLLRRARNSISRTTFRPVTCRVLCKRLGLGWYGTEDTPALKAARIALYVAMRHDDRFIASRGARFDCR